MVFFRDQRITPAQQVDYRKRLGETEINANAENFGIEGSPEIDVISNIQDNGRAIGTRRAGETWHTDMSYAKRPAWDALRDDCTGIVGMHDAQGEALIAALADHVVKPEFIYQHHWRQGDVVIWDNCTVQHRAVMDYDLPQRRLMWRTTLKGEVPV